MKVNKPLLCYKTTNKQAHVASQIFTKEQILEQQEFSKNLANGKIKIAFSGTFKEGIQFLKDTGKLVDAFNHS